MHLRAFFREFLFRTFLTLSLLTIISQISHAQSGYQMVPSVRVTVMKGDKPQEGAVVNYSTTPGGSSVQSSITNSNGNALSFLNPGDYFLSATFRSPTDGIYKWPVTKVSVGPTGLAVTIKDPYLEKAYARVTFFPRPTDGSGVTDCSVEYFVQWQDGSKTIRVPDYNYLMAYCTCDARDSNGVCTQMSAKGSFFLLPPYYAEQIEQGRLPKDFTLPVTVAYAFAYFTPADPSKPTKNYVCGSKSKQINCKGPVPISPAYNAMTAIGIDLAPEVKSPVRPMGF